jgi:hypothetical protein
MRQRLVVLKHLNDIWFIELGGVVLIFVNAGGKRRYIVFKNIYVEIGIKAAKCEKPVQLKTGFYD